MFDECDTECTIGRPAATGMVSLSLTMSRREGHGTRCETLLTILTTASLLLVIPKKNTWDQIPQRILSMGSGFNEAPRDLMRKWAASYSERTGRDVKVIWEREFSTTNFNDLGLCAIFHQLNVTLAVAWQQKLVPPDSYKPVERMVNPISLGIPVVLFQNPFQPRRTHAPEMKVDLRRRHPGAKLEHLIEN